MKFDEIEMAFMYVSSNQPFMNSAYISRQTGEVYYVSELGDSDKLPDDIDDASIYVSIPHKDDLALGKNLVFDFVSEFLPADFDENLRYLVEREHILDSSNYWIVGEDWMIGIHTKMRVKRQPC